jgi:hypothetical protein
VLNTFSWGSLCVTFCTALEGAGIIPKSLLAGASVHSPLKLGLDWAKSVLADSTITATTNHFDIFIVSS